MTTKKIQRIISIIMVSGLILGLALGKAYDDHTQSQVNASRNATTQVTSCHSHHHCKSANSSDTEQKILELKKKAEELHRCLQGSPECSWLRCAH